MEYIKFPKKWCIDYTPEDGVICGRCAYYEICPFDYTCKTLERVQDYENMDDDNSDLRDE